MPSITGKFIRKAREAQDFSQVMVSNSMGFTSVFLARIESGHVSLPAKHVEKLSKILNVTREELLDCMKKDMGEKLERLAR